jgi:hypothetical protein
MSLVSAIDAAGGAIRRFGRSALPADATVPEAGATTKAAEVISSSLPAQQSDGIALMADDDPEVLSRPYTEEEIRELAARAALTGRPLEEILTEIEATFQAWSLDKKASEAIFFQNLVYHDELLLTLRKDFANAQLAAGPLQIERAGHRVRLENLTREIRQQIEIKLGSIPAARDLQSKRDHEQAVLKAEEEWQRGGPARQLRLDQIDTACRELEATLMRSAAQAVSFIGRGLHFLPGLMLLLVALFSIPGLAGAAAALFTNDVPARDIVREGALAVVQMAGFGPQSLITWAILGLLSIFCVGIAYRVRTLFHVSAAAAVAFGMVAIWGITAQLGGTPLLLSTSLILLMAVTGSIFGSIAMDKTAGSAVRTIAAIACSAPAFSLLAQAALHNRITWTVALLTGAILAMAGAAIGFTVLGNVLTRRRLDQLRAERTALMNRPDPEQAVPCAQPGDNGDTHTVAAQDNPELALRQLVSALGSDAIKDLMQLINQQGEASVTLALAEAKLAPLEAPIAALGPKVDAQEREATKRRDYVKNYNLHVQHRQRDFDTGRIRARLIASEAYYLTARALRDDPSLGQGEGAHA